MAPEIRQIRCGDLSLCLGLAGKGPPLLFLGGTHWDLRNAATPLTSPLTEHYTVALFDQRGQGRSGKPPGPYTMQDYARDARDVLDHLGWARAAVVGYSFGGMVAQELVIGFPDRASKLILAASTPGGAGGSSYPLEALLHLPPEARARRGLEIADLRFTALQASDPAAAERMVAQRVATLSRFADEPGARQGLEAQLGARAAHDCFDRLGDVAIPTLVLAGVDDGQAPFAAQEAMAARLPNAEMRAVPGAHGFLFETGAGYAEMLRFLAA